LQHLLAAAVLGQGRMALAQPAIGAHGGPVRILPQRILLQQPLRHSQGSRVLPGRLPAGHQLRQHVAIEALQPVALGQHPVVVEAVQEIAAIQLDGLLQHRRARPPRPTREAGAGFGSAWHVKGSVQQLLEFSHVQPERGLGVELHIGRIGQDEVIVRETAADLPQRGGKGAARIVLGPIAPEEGCQVLAALWPAAVHEQIGQQRL
jgi:hypothetical protein